jgi:hypothetical protein
VLLGWRAGVTSKGAALDKSAGKAWRQLLAGDKEPEAYLDRHARAALRDDLRHLIWRRYRRWAIAIGAVIFVVAMALPHLVKLGPR